MEEKVCHVVILISFICAITSADWTRVHLHVGRRRTENKRQLHFVSNFFQMPRSVLDTDLGRFPCPIFKLPIHPSIHPVMKKQKGGNHNRDFGLRLPSCVRLRAPLTETLWMTAACVILFRRIITRVHDSSTRAATAVCIQVQCQVSSLSPPGRAALPDLRSIWISARSCKTAN